MSSTSSDRPVGGVMVFCQDIESCIQASEHTQGEAKEYLAMLKEHSIMVVITIICQRSTRTSKCGFKDNKPREVLNINVVDMR